MISSRDDIVTQFVSRSFLSQKCFDEGVSMKFQGCFEAVLREFQGGFNGVLRKFQGRLKESTWMFHESYKED